jgi:hypothetical protein
MLFHKLFNKTVSTTEAAYSRLRWEWEGNMMMMMIKVTTYMHKEPQNFYELNTYRRNYCNRISSIFVIQITTQTRIPRVHITLLLNNELIFSSQESKIKKPTRHLFSCWFLARLILRPWRWRRYVPPKHRFTLNGLRGVISRKIVLFITTAVRTSNPTKSME